METIPRRLTNESRYRFGMRFAKNYTVPAHKRKEGHQSPINHLGILTSTEAKG